MGPAVDDDFATALYAVLDAYVNRLGVRSFNVALYLPPLAPVAEDWSVLPGALGRVVDRGDLNNKTADIGAMELYAASVVASDPFPGGGGAGSGELKLLRLVDLTFANKCAILQTVQHLFYFMPTFRRPGVPMRVPRSTGKTWDFARSLSSGRVTLWPREGRAPRYIGRLEDMPALLESLISVVPHALEGRIPLLRLSPALARWAGSRPLAVVGEVAAGRYDVTVAYHLGPEALDILHLPPEWARAGYFALRVRGDSMREAGIREGDYVLVRPQSSADNGDLVVAGLTDSDAPEGYVTLKQFFWEGDHIRLQPANGAMAPIHLFPERGRDPVEIQGKVVAVVRVEE